MRGVERLLCRARGERAQTMTEYALIMAIICAGCIAAFATFQSSVTMTLVDEVSTLISGL